MTLGRECRMLLLGCLMMAATGMAAHAQGPGGPGGPGGGGGMGMPGGGGRMGGGGVSGGGRMGGGGMRGGNGGGSSPSSGMSGRWWDNKGMAKSLGLNGDQQKRMDHVFTQNRDVLQQRYDAFVKQQTKLDAMKRSNTASESELFTEIQRTATARAELEQAYTHMQLQIKGELTPEQAKTLDTQK
jgi:Spy/CpxP family protein refolding chaperone